MRDFAARIVLQNIRFVKDMCPPHGYGYQIIVRTSSKAGSMREP